MFLLNTVLQYMYEFYTPNDSAFTSPKEYWERVSQYI